jgi:hypothetical protein
MSDVDFTTLMGPAIDRLDTLKDSQGQPPSSGDITYDRILAVARSLQRMVEVQGYLLDQIKLTEDMPHRQYTRHHRMQDELHKARQTLDVFFFGD